MTLTSEDLLAISNLLDVKLKPIDNRLTSLEVKVDNLESKVDKMDRRLTNLEIKVFYPFRVQLSAVPRRHASAFLRCDLPGGLQRL